MHQVRRRGSLRGRRRVDVERHYPAVGGRRQYPSRTDGGHAGVTPDGLHDHGQRVVVSLRADLRDYLERTVEYWPETLSEHMIDLQVGYARQTISRIIDAGT